MKLSRRTLLRGAGGAVVGLPVLECMLNSNGTRLANAQALPSRYSIVFAGQSLCGDHFEKNSQRIDGGSLYSEDGHFIAPSQTGSDFALTTPLLPLMNLRDQFSLVSNMRIPWNANSVEGDAVPAGGAYRDFHGGAAGPLLCGTRSTEARFTARSITSDQVVADLYNGETIHGSLVYRAQPVWYLSGSDFAGREYISYGLGGRRIQAQSSPAVAYQALFGNFMPPDDADSAAHNFRQLARRSVLDLISSKRQRLLGRVGQTDRLRLEAHFDAIRDLEQRIAAIPPVTGGVCMAPTDPGGDPTVGENNAGSGSSDLATTTGYSDEDSRGRVFADLIHMAYACDLARTATLQITCFQSHMNVHPVSSDLGLPILADLHEVGHNGDERNRGQLPVSTMLRWHMGIYAHLLQKLADTPEGDGTLLDRCVNIFLPEGGHGTQLNDGATPNQTHSVEHMVAVLGGGSALGLRLGQHVRAQDGTHPAQALITGMQAAGFPGDQLGEVDGNIPELLV